MLAAGIAVHYARQRHQWLKQVTLEVEATSAPAMSLTIPTEAVLWLKTSGGEQRRVRTADWTSMIPKPTSRLRFDFPQDHYADAVFFPDPSITRIEIAAVRLISHGTNRVVNVPLDRVGRRQHLDVPERTNATVTFARVNEEGLPAVELHLADLLDEMPPAGRISYTEWLFIFLGALVVILGSLALLRESLVGKERVWPDAAPQPGVWFRAGSVLALAACMAVAAPGNSHPDEYLHVEAARYYAQHWLPPDLTNPWVAPTFSHYGQTYLLGTDLAYLFAGKFLLFTQPLFPSAFAALRCLNVSAFAVLLLWIACFFRGSAAAIALFLTPQLWYVFSGYNADAWALLVSCLLVGQMSSERSSLQRYLNASGNLRSYISVLPPLALSCLVLCSKRNYLVIFLFFAGWLVLELIDRRSQPGLARRVLLVLPLIFLPLALQFGLMRQQARVNHDALSSVAAQQAEKYAQAEFKPSVLQKGPGRLARTEMRKRGVTLIQMLTREGWLYYTAASFLGTYGWLEFFSSRSFYIVMAAGWAVFLAVSILGSFRGQSRHTLLINATAWLCALLVVALSIYFSWNFDFEPQGRYLFPIISLLLYLVNTVHAPLRTYLCKTSWLLWGLSVYGFLVFGIGALVEKQG
jgi:hypothetical protein